MGIAGYTIERVWEIKVRRWEYQYVNSFISQFPRTYASIYASIYQLTRRKVEEDSNMLRKKMVYKELERKKNENAYMRQCMCFENTCTPS